MIGDKVKIEFARQTDVSEISVLSRKYIEYDLRWNYTPGKIMTAIMSKTKNVVVARKNNKLVGFGIMTYNEEQANLDLLAVKTMYRRRGIGRLIIEWLEQVALSAGIYNVFVQARKINKGAIKFYKKLGFQVIDEISGFYQDQETGVIMSKNLRQMIQD